MSIKVTSWVWEHATAKGTELLLLLALADQANDDGELFMLKSTIARKGRVHEDTADRQLARLIETGQVQRIPRPGRSNVYRVIMDNPPAKCTPPQNAGDSSEHPPAACPPTPPQDAGDTPPQTTPPEPPREPLPNQPTTPAPPETAPADVLTAAVVGGLAESAPHLAGVIARDRLRATCQRLADLRWTDLQLRAWVTSPAQQWAGLTSGGGVIYRLEQLGQPPERPRSALPRPQNVCPEHETPMRAGTCPECVRKATHGPPDEFRAARRRVAPGADESATPDHRPLEAS